MPHIACHPELRTLAAGLLAGPPGALPFAGLTALLVEDSRVASEGLRLMWRRGGGRIRRAESLAQARVHWRTYRPDVVIVDLGLPDGRGEDLIREFATGARSDQIAGSGGQEALAGMAAMSGRLGWTRPALILGLSGDPDGRAAALAAGACAFLEKPLPSFGALQRLIEDHLPQAMAVCPAGDEPRADMPVADGLGLRDDMAMALRLLQQPLDDAGRSYIARFLISLSRMTGDHSLLALGENFANGSLAADMVANALELRLAGGARL